MHRNVLLSTSQRFSSCRTSAFKGTLPGLCRNLHEHHETKYADKLRLRAEETGISVDELKVKAKEQQHAERKKLREAHEERIAKEKAEKEKQQQQSTPIGENPSKTSPRPSTRKDNSPIKPLSSILNLPRILSINANQVSALWTAYHASRSEGTGRGYLCASIPVDLYEKMSAVGAKYPSFVLPVPRPQKFDLLGEKAHEGEAQTEETAYEMYFMEWGFHEAPEVPSPKEPELLAPKAESGPTTTVTGPNPAISTVLFTPLQEYKMRTSFATPYLVLTHYTDLAKTHGIVLLRGEITPSSGGQGFLLSQEDAQILSMGVQKFYLWEDQKAKGGSRGEQILKAFHESPDSFNWEDMLAYGTQTA
ncbi:ATP11-domain-containing protein [Dendrothele bispora CBS 962.96]|uniref:ATP11-domain-containing protein n=1 Tax=Dendrothele bispora (strain CBS 962.96) TaxID=1314807 RepID=A0A4S8LRX4_DENBC|nr:ATP11-domain-containing protein [Dendrothele bispora CBS 962.96]